MPPKDQPEHKKGGCCAGPWCRALNRRLGRGGWHTAGQQQRAVGVGVVGVGDNQGNKLSLGEASGTTLEAAEPADSSWLSQPGPGPEDSDQDGCCLLYSVHLLALQFRLYKLKMYSMRCSCQLPAPLAAMALPGQLAASPAPTPAAPVAVVATGQVRNASAALLATRP